jgi:hypothetical protein
MTRPLREALADAINDLADESLSYGLADSHGAITDASRDQLRELRFEVDWLMQQIPEDLIVRTEES